ncbi:FecR domain-containing protein [Mesorhizobium sp. L-8-3]|uniref:FecR domain-containing protein n=1 Tax=Mesorhizobium sp. L-8-3 TaxID=2744522 RepID=UPI001927A7CB|nr:FecR domain-containing protein [Mesorhizobium sp. L-8-3]BCH27455.1 TonB-dependent receptor [Mesorhizobium sp. L-8-3]
MRKFRAGVAALAVLGCMVSAHAEIFPRSQPAAGSVIARKSGEEVQFIDLAGWRGVDIRQNLIAGDELRTNAYGHLAILFADDTQLRMGRNTTLVVKKVGDASDSEFMLQSGTIWARAQRGGAGLTVETPAAAAAIRGTDWTMTVEGDKTSLIVLEGVVELSNELGSVRVAQGEAAVARIGQAPTKVVIVAPKDREQMLYYLTLRQSFASIPASPLSAPDMRAERDRISAKPDTARSAEDWLVLAEVSLTYDGRQAAQAAAAQARAFRLTAGQKARLDLIDALLAGADQQYAEAARLFERAASRLDARRRAVALYGGYFARALANPDYVEQPPVIRGGGPQAALAEAWAAGFLKDLKSAAEVLRRAEAQYPDDPTLPAYRAQIAILLDDREQVEAAVERALALDPDEPTALEARATYKAGIKSDLDGALADLERATAIAPGSVTIWNALGNLQSERDAERESEAALKRAIELEPNDPVAYANLAFIYLDQDRVEEAKALIDKAIAVDPSFDIGLVARGRYYLQTGEMDKAMQDLLAGSTANPAYAQALLLLAGGYFEKGDQEAGEQALENADRLDPNDPVISNMATVVAIDDYDSDRAILSAQETLRRSRARGGAYAPLSANKDAGSTVNDAFRLQGLDAWGRYYGDIVFDPFTASGYVDQALAGSADPFANQPDFGSIQAEPVPGLPGFSSFFQGLMLDPQMLSAPERGIYLYRKPFFESALGGGFTNSGGNWGWNTEAELRSYSATPMPWTTFLQFSAQEDSEQRPLNNPSEPILIGSSLDTNYKLLSGSGFVTASPTPNDRIVTYFNVTSSDQRYEGNLAPGIIPPGVLVEFADESDSRLSTGAAAWSHTFGYRNVASVAVFASNLDRKQDKIRAFPQIDPDTGTAANVRILDNESNNQSAYLIAANHMLGVGDAVIRYGAEGGIIDLDYSRSTFLSFPDFPIIPPIQLLDEKAAGTAGVGRTYLDVLYGLSPGLQIDGGLSGIFISGGSIEINRLEPRLGISWSPADGHWLRAGFLRETMLVGSTTLAPIGVLGLQSNQAPLGLGGYSDSTIARWDAEWTSRFFTTVEYQHQELHGLSIDQPAQFGSIDLTKGRIDRVSATANAWLGHGFGAFATFAYADSKNQDPISLGFGGPLPFVPETTARFGLTYVNPWNVKATAAATYVGSRSGNAVGDRLEGYWTTDAFLTWEPFDKRLELQLAAYNILDQKFDVAIDGTTGVPGWGRTLVGSLKVRF